MAAPLLTLQDIHLTIGTTELLLGAELLVSPGERICIVGRNGSGKSTLMKIAAGQVEPDGGRVFVQPGADVRYLPQEPDLSGYPDTHAYVADGLAPGDDSRAYYLLGQLGFNGDEDVTTLSGGQARRVALARVLAPKPDVVLLDEPTNHLDLPTILWLEKELKSMKGALVLVSHDRSFLNSLSKITVWLDRGVTRRLEQGFGEYEAWRDGIIEAEEAARHKTDRKIAAEEHWVKYGVTARRKRNVRRMAELKELREARRTAKQQVGQVNMTISDAQGAGSCIIAADHLHKAFGDHVVVDDFSMRILRKDRIGIVGGNGAGKTTLIKLLIGKLEPDSGEVVLGTNLSIASLDQVRTLDPEKTLAETLSGGGNADMMEVGGQMRHVNSYMQDFLFTPEQARTPVSVLSGGERARLLLAKALAKPANFLVLDEPTNDLDLETLDLLENLIVDYPGTVLLVSHDRDFLDKTVSGVLMAEGNGAFTEYAGGYSDMVAQRGEGITVMAEATHGTAATAGEKVAKPKAKARAANTKRKLTYADQYALENLPKEMEKLVKLMEDLQAKLADPNLYSRDPAAFQKYSDALSKAQADHEAAEERWLELEIKREEIEG